MWSEKLVMKTLIVSPQKTKEPFRTNQQHKNEWEASLHLQIHLFLKYIYSCYEIKNSTKTIFKKSVKSVQKDHNRWKTIDKNLTYQILIQNLTTVLK